MLSKTQLKRIEDEAARITGSVLGLNGVFLNLCNEDRSYNLEIDGVIALMFDETTDGKVILTPNSDFVAHDLSSIVTLCKRFKNIEVAAPVSLGPCGKIIRGEDYATERARRGETLKSILKADTHDLEHLWTTIIGLPSGDGVTRRYFTHRPLRHHFSIIGYDDAIAKEVETIASQIISAFPWRSEILALIECNGGITVVVKDTAQNVAFAHRMAQWVKIFSADCRCTFGWNIFGSACVASDKLGLAEYGMMPVWIICDDGSEYELEPGDTTPNEHALTDIDPAGIDKSFCPPLPVSRADDDDSSAEMLYPLSILEIKRQAMLGNPDACLLQGKMYLCGLMTQGRHVTNPNWNREVGQSWIRKAADQGNFEAKLILERLPPPVLEKQRTGIPQLEPKGRSGTLKASQTMMH